MKKPMPELHRKLRVIQAHIHRIPGKIAQLRAECLDTLATRPDKAADIQTILTALQELEKKVPLL